MSKKKSWAALTSLLLMMGILLIGLAGCGGKNGQDNTDNDSAKESVSTQEIKSESDTAEPAISETEVSDASETEQVSSSEEEETEDSQTDKDVLVVYFSCTGTTKDVAEKIAAITDADIYEIKAAQEYTSADLDWNDEESRTTKEQNDPSVRPEIGSDPVSTEGYSTIYIGYPIWWGEEPRIMDTFVESSSFDGVTVIPFCTSSSSGIGRSGENLADLAGSGNWLDGQRFGAGASETDIESWIEGLQ